MIISVHREIPDFSILYCFTHTQQLFFHFVAAEKHKEKENFTMVKHLKTIFTG